MLNKSKRNKIKIRSTKKKYKQRTKKNYKYGGQVKKKRSVVGFVTTAFTGQFLAHAPDIDKEEIYKIGFEIPKDPQFKANEDNYKFLEMADRDLKVDMERKLNKYELEVSGGYGAQYCKYMYLIRATTPGSGNTVLHYICNHRSVEMFQLVWPYYLVLYNEKFPELLEYYVNKKNNFGKTPLDLLQYGTGPTLNLDYRSRWIEGSFGMIKNAALRGLNIQKLGTTVLQRMGNITGRAEFIEKILRKFGGKKSTDTSGPNDSNSFGGPSGSSSPSRSNRFGGPNDSNSFGGPSGSSSPSRSNRFGGPNDSNRFGGPSGSSSPSRSNRFGGPSGSNSFGGPSRSNSFGGPSGSSSPSRSNSFGGPSGSSSPSRSNSFGGPSGSSSPSRSNSFGGPSGSSSPSRSNSSSGPGLSAKISSSSFRGSIVPGPNNRSRYTHPADKSSSSGSNNTSSSSGSNNTSSSSGSNNTSSSIVKDNEFYELLGLPRSATKGEIKTAYRQAAMKYHPDRNSDGNATEMMQKINRANTILTNESARRLYDMYGKSGVTAYGGTSKQYP